jgi:hypothetical protein
MPPTKLIKKEGFAWTLETQQAFITLKDKLTSTSTLILLDLAQTFTLECDAYDEGRGVVLMQHG